MSERETILGFIASAQVKDAIHPDRWTLVIGAARRKRLNRELGLPDGPIVRFLGVTVQTDYTEPEALHLQQRIDWAERNAA